MFIGRVAKTDETRAFATSLSIDCTIHCTPSSSILYICSISNHVIFRRRIVEGFLIKKSLCFIVHNSSLLSS